MAADRQGKHNAPSRRAMMLGVALIAAATAVAYLPVIVHGGYVWDDDFYVTKNPLLAAPDGLFRIWFTTDSPSQYFPLVYTTFRIEHALWGLNPLGYHLVNVALHALNAILILVLLRRLGIPGAWLAAAIFALHPVHVESVAWITERKNVLSTLFYLLSLLAWLAFTDPSSRRPRLLYALALAAHFLALTAKTTACTQPLVLLIILWFRRDRISLRRVLQVLPFLVLSLGMGLVTVWWERVHQGTAGARFDFPLLERVLIASRALWFYAGKLVWPSRLAFSYERWEIDPGEPAQYLWLVGCVAAAIFLWRQRALGRGPAAAVLLFVVALFPMLGFFSLWTFVYTFVADHYQYTASIGLIALGAAGLSLSADRLRERTGRPRIVHAAVVLVCAALLTTLGTLTWRQSEAYRDEETLWHDTLKKNPRSFIAHNNLGAMHHNRGDLDKAEYHCRKALEINPEYYDAYYNLGLTMYRLGRPDDAMRYYRLALRYAPDYVWAMDDLAGLLDDRGDYDEAIRLLRKAVRLAPNYEPVREHLELVLEKKRRTQPNPAP